MRTIALVLIAVACQAQDVFGTWKMNLARSTFPGQARPRSFTVRIEPHPNGQVFTLDQTGADGRATTSSTILYLDGKPRDFRDSTCAGTQSSARGGNGAVKVVRNCESGAWIKLVFRIAGQPKELILDITEQHPNGRRFERRLTLEKQ